MIDTYYALAVIALMALITFALRALPFVASRWLQSHPIVRRLGRFLPLAIMTLLLVNSGLAAAAGHAFGPWPELLAISLVAGLQWRYKNALVSILVCTALYVLMRNLHVLVS